MSAEVSKLKIAPVKRKNITKYLRLRHQQYGFPGIVKDARFVIYQLLIFTVSSIIKITHFLHSL